LQTSGVASIADYAARQSRARSLLTQAFDDDLRSWVMSQPWYKDAGINSDVELVLDRIRAKIEEEDDPYTAFAELMARPWQNTDTADTFWVDIQTKVRYCGMRDAYHTDHVLRTLWASRYGDDEAKKEFALHPKWSASDCYRKAKGLEQVRHRQDGAGSVSVVKSTYKGGNGGGPRPRSSRPPRGGRSQTPGPTTRSRSTAQQPTEDNSACLNCGYEGHGEGGRCPAAGKKCNVCGKTGHFGRHCPYGAPAANATTASRTSTASTSFVANHVYAPQVASTVTSGPNTPFFVNHLDTLDVTTDLATIATSTDVTEVSRYWKETDEDSKWFGVRVNVKNGSDYAAAATVTGAFTTTRGERAAYVLIDGVKTPTVRLLKDVTVQKYRLPNGNWVPVRKKINGKPE
jgi:hypothetical protein